MEIQHVATGVVHALCGRGSRFCYDHFLTWKPDIVDYDQKSRKELRALLDQACSKQWRPTTELMESIIRESGKVIPASRLINIDLECNFSTIEVLQVGMADFEGAKVLDCLTRYKKEIPPSKSKKGTWAQRRYKEKVRSYFTQDGIFDAEGVVKRLREMGISQKTRFLSWGSWCFDLSFLRDWLAGRMWFRRTTRRSQCLLAVAGVPGEHEQDTGEKMLPRGEFSPISPSNIPTVLWRKSPSSRAQPSCTRRCYATSSHGQSNSVNLLTSEKIKS
jgi:hypothetical protein